jgi:hypothetical protein
VSVIELPSPDGFTILYELRHEGKRPKRTRKRKFSPPPPLPTKEQVDEFAVTIAINDNMVDKHFLKLICWQPGDSVEKFPKRKLKKYFHMAQRHRSEACALLVRCMAENHALMLRRLRRHGHRVSTRYWTAKPTKHGHPPPPRRRGYLFPMTLPGAAARLLASGAAPPRSPPPAEHPGATHPSRCLRDPLLFRPGGGQGQSALRQRPLGTSSPNASPCSLTTE